MLSGASSIWKDIHTTRQLVKDNTKSHIGDGKSVLILKDAWGFVQRPIIPKMPVLDSNLRVSDFMLSQSQTWDRGKVLNFFEPSSATKILNIIICQSSAQDIPYWTGTTQGTFSVKSAYWVSKGFSAIEEVWKTLWKLNIHERHKLNLWRLAKDILPITHKLKQRGLTIEETCALCGNQQ